MLKGQSQREHVWQTERKAKGGAVDDISTFKGGKRKRNNNGHKGGILQVGEEGESALLEAKRTEV